jgi:heme/copper-type cytochrome/quinol oxidase subunit 3
MMAKPIATTRSVTEMPTGRLAVWWVIVSEIFIFGGLLACYIMHRLGHPEWSYQSANTNVWIGGFNTLVLLTSSYFAVMAHAAAEDGDGKLAFKRLIITSVGGLIFIMVKSYEWTMEISHGYTITSSGFWSFYYTAAGLHALHVIAGVVIMLIIGYAASKGRELQRVEYIGIYWHIVDLIWIFLFPLLYIAK